MRHLSDEQLSALVDGALEGGARAPVERHLEICADCREALAGLVAQDRALSSVLEHDPGEDYFESFVGRVGGRLRAAGLKGAQAREPEGRSLADWFRSPRKLALVAAVATVVAGAGIVMLATREVRVPALREKEIESRALQEVQSPQPAGSSSVQPSSGAPATPPAAEAPVTEAARSRADSREAPGAGSMEEMAAPERGAHVPSNRAYEVRRNTAGEEAPVGKPGGLVHGPPRSVPAPQPAAPGTPVYVSKQRYVEPLESRSRTDAMRGGARPAPAEGGALPVAGQIATEAADKGALEEESKSMAAPRAERAAIDQKEMATSLRFRGGRSGGAALQVAGTRDAFDDLPTQPRTLAKNAQRLTALAETMGVAPAWDSAASEWERVIEGVQGAPLERETRFQLARARFMAWQREASAKRAERARQALEAFLARAPKGVERDSAQAWMRAFER